MLKNLVLGLILAHLDQIRAIKMFFTNLTPSVTICDGQLSSCAISEKTNDPILRKISDGWTDRWTDRQTDKSDFMGRCPTNVDSIKI